MNESDGSGGLRSHGLRSHGVHSHGVHPDGVPHGESRAGPRHPGESRADESRADESRPDESRADESRRHESHINESHPNGEHPNESPPNGARLGESRVDEPAHRAHPNGPPLAPPGRDATEILVGFARTLAAAGLAVGPDRTATFLTATGRLTATRPRDVYWAGRLTMTAQPDDLPVYDAVFDAYFGGSRHGHQRAPQRPRITAADLPASDAADGEHAGDQDGENPPVRAKATAMEILRHRDLGKLTADERAQLTAMLDLLRPGLPTRRSRRRGPAATGPVDRRRTIRAMLAAGGEPGIPEHQRPRPKPRRIVLLIDVSGSMAPYADALLRFAHVLVRHIPSATEVFTIGTRLSRVTRALAVRDPDAALAAAADVIPDFSGGTRLGEAIKAFNDRWGQRGTAHGAIVVVFSDGWERGTPDLLAEQVERLQRLARGVVWVNPHKGREGYLPVQSGIVAVLPHVDHFVAGHSLATLEQLLEVIRGA